MDNKHGVKEKINKGKRHVNVVAEDGGLPVPISIHQQLDGEDDSESNVDIFIQPLMRAPSRTILVLDYVEKEVGEDESSGSHLKRR